MIIEKIDIKSFGLLENMTLEFSDTVNVIEGQNEAGKSTIASFIKYMLFGFDVNDPDGVLSERRKRINWNTGVAQGSMVVRVKDKRYLISRSTVPSQVAEGARQTYKEDSSIIDLETGTTAFGKLPAGEVVFGVSKELFENTSFIGQIGDSAINEGSVKESIENILFSASERINTQRAEGRIRDKMEGLIHKGGQGGVIFDLVKKQEALEEQMSRSDEDNKAILAKETELFTIKRERSDSEDKLNKLYDLDSCYKNVMLIQTFDKLHELEEECAAKTEAYNSFIEENTKADYCPQDDYYNELVSTRRAVNDTYRALYDAEENYSREKNAVGITREIEGYIELADELGTEEKILDDALKHRKSVIGNAVCGSLSAALSLGSLVGALVLSGVGATVGLGAGAVAFASLGVFTLVKLLGAKKALGALESKFSVSTYQDLKGKIGVISEARAKRDGMIRSTDSAKAAAEKARIEYDIAKGDLTRAILRWGEEPPSHDLNDFLDKLEKKVGAFLERKKVLLEEKNTIDLTVKEIRRTLSDKNEIDIRAQVSPLKRKALSRINHDEIITGIAAYKSKIAQHDKLIYNVESELMLLKSRAGDPADLYSKIDGLDTRVEELKHRHKAYFIALKAIESATDNLRAGISPRLGEYSTALMEIMTDNKYKSFDVSGGLKLSYTTEGGEDKSVDFLSGGTRDLAYIAVRMALVDMLYSEKPPIVFDESFAHQDNIRARSMMKALAHLSGDGYQSFVFTCRSRESALASELCPNAGIFKLSVSDGND